MNAISKSAQLLYNKIELHFENNKQFIILGTNMKQIKLTLKNYNKWKEIDRPFIKIIEGEFYMLQSGKYVCASSGGVMMLGCIFSTK